ncbi:hypothetical protein ABK040_013819 [Willaertia magna]
MFLKKRASKPSGEQHNSDNNNTTNTTDYDNRKEHREPSSFLPKRQNVNKQSFNKKSYNDNNDRKFEKYNNNRRNDNYNNRGNRNYNDYYNERGNNYDNKKRNRNETNFNNKRNNNNYTKTHHDAPKSKYNKREEEVKDIYNEKNGKNNYPLDPDISEYYQRITEMMKKNEFQTDEERFQFISSVIDYTCQLRFYYDDNENKNSTKSKNLFLSTLNVETIEKTLKQLLPLCSKNDLYLFLKNCLNDFIYLSTGKYSSFLLQELIKIIPESLKEEENLKTFDELEIKEEEENNISDLLKDLNKLILKNFKFMMNHNNSSFVLREFITCLGYMNDNKDNVCLLDKFLNKLFREFKINYLLEDNSSVGFIVSLIENIHKLILEKKENNFIKCNDDCLDKVINFILLNNEEEKIIMEQLNCLINNSRNARIVDSIIECCNDKFFNEIIIKFIENNCNVFCLNSYQCYSIVNTLQRVNREQFKNLFKLMKDNLKECITKETLNVLVAVTKCCIKFEMEQDIIRPLNLNNEIIRKLIYNNEKGMVMNRHGCTLLSLFFTFQSKKLIQPIAEVFKQMDNKEYYKLCVSKEGSLVIDSLVQYDDIFIEKLKDKVVDFSLNCYANYIIEKCILFCKDEKLLKDLAILLVNEEKKIRSNQFGSIMWLRLNLSNFKSKPKEWLASKKEGRLKKKKETKLLDELEKPSSNNRSINATNKQKKTEKKITKEEASTPLSVDDFLKEEEPLKDKNKEDKKRKKEMNSLLDNILDIGFKKQK